MKPRNILSILTVILSTLKIMAQPIFVYDQQSATEGTGGGASLGIQAYQPVGQSFTPGLSEIGFVRLRLTDVNAGNGLGATFVVNLRSNTIDGTILGTSASVLLPDSFSGYPDFFFLEAVPLVPGMTYVLEPVIQSGDAWATRTYTYDYAGGTVIAQGVPNANLDLWFREGIVVPEPSSVALLLVGGGICVYARRKFHRK